MAGNKTKPTELSIKEFIEAIADEARHADARSLIKLIQSATGEEPKMWGPSIVGFASYHYKYESGREGDTPLVGFSPRKAATVLYGVTEALPADLGKYTTGKGCLYIKKLADVDQKALKDLVVKAVAASARAPRKCSSGAVLVITHLASY